MIYLLCNDKQQIITNGYPYLCVHSILCRSKERFDIQVLLYPFKEEFDLPSFSVKFRYSKCRQVEVIGQKSIYVVLTFCVVFVDYESHCIRIVLGNHRTGKFNCLVTNQTGLLIDFMPFYNFESHVVFSPCNIESISFLKAVIKTI